LNKVVYWISYRYHHYRLSEYQLKFHTVTQYHHIIQPCLVVAPPWPRITCIIFPVSTNGSYVVHSQHLHIPMLHSKGLNNVHFEGSVWWRGAAYSWQMIGLCVKVGQIQMYSVTARADRVNFTSLPWLN